MNTTDVVIFGAGGLAREVAWVLEAPGTRLDWQDDRQTLAIRLVGHLDDRTELHGTQVNGRPVLGGSAWLADRPGHAVIVAIGNPDIRKRIVQTLRDHGSTFPSILPSHFVAGDHGTIGEGVIVLPGAMVTVNVSICNFVLLNPHVSISHDGQVGEYTSLGPGVSLAGNVRIGAGCDIGTNVSVIPGVHVGDNTIIGAGACVTKNMPDHATAVGIPAKVIKIAEPE